ncbi:MAG: hypothetical protein SFV54_18625 [Bryobacteraceae bacterium]|nr:hypothetical protein [Bryobacteraceae bacterium]
MPHALQSKFTAALDRLIEQIREDRSILAAILCGSLAHDTVWSKSDIDLALVAVDGRKTETSHVSLNADGVNVHAILMPRAEFRRAVESAARNSFLHSFLAKGRLLYTHDESIAALCSRLHEIGERDTQVQLLAAACAALLPVDKAHKWFVTRGDLDYTALWILYAATPLARIEVLSARLLAAREVILQALELNPSFFRTIYTDLLNAKKTRKSIQSALDAVDGYLAARALDLFRLIVDYLNEAGETRSATEIDTHFQRNFNIECVSVACEYLADRGLIAKVATQVQLTRLSNVLVQEQAFVHLGDPPDEF